MGDTEAKTAITTAVAGPKRVQGDEGAIEQQSIEELRKLKAQQDAEALVPSSGPKLTLLRMVPPGAQ